MRTGLSICLFIVVVAIAAACGGGDGTPPDSLTPAPTRLVYPRPTPTPTAYLTPIPLAERATGPLIVRASSNWNTDIYRVDADGSNLVNLTNDPSSEWSPQWLGDSQRITFSSARNGQSELFSMRDDGSDVRNLPGVFDGGETLLSWSPNGASVLFGYFTEDSGEYWTMNADGNNRTQILSNCSICGVRDWSPDGSRLAGYQFGDDGNPYLFTVGSDGGDLRRLADLSFSYTFTRWSPQGDVIAYWSRDRDRNMEELWLINPNTGEQRRLYSSQAIRSFDWAPDGSELAVAIRNQLLIVDVATGQSAMVADGIEMFDVTWSPSREQIAFVSNMGRQSDVYVVPVASGEPFNVSTGPWIDHEPQWSPDGSFLIFRSDRDSRDGIYALGLDGSDQERLIALPPGGLTTEEAEAIELPEVLGGCGEEYFVPGFHRLRACRAQDRLQVAFVRGFEDLDNVQVVVRNVVAGEARIVPTQGYVPEERLVAWAPDSESIALYGTQGGERWLYVLRLDDGFSRRLVRGDDVGMHSDLLWSPDGEYVYYTQGTDCRGGGCAPGYLYRIRADGTGDPEQMSELRITTLYGFQP